MTTRSQKQSAGEREQAITAPRSRESKRGIAAYIATAERHLAWCEAHDLPVSADRTRGRIVEARERLAALTTKGATA